MTTKRYPFSMTKHAHDVDYRKNWLFNRINDWEGVHGYTAKQIEQMEKEYDDIVNLMSSMLWNSNGHVTWLTGKEYGLAKKCVVWASERRASHCKPEYRQYC